MPRPTDGTDERAQESSDEVGVHAPDATRHVACHRHTVGSARHTLDAEGTMRCHSLTISYAPIGLITVAFGRLEFSAFILLQVLINPTKPDIGRVAFENAPFRRVLDTIESFAPILLAPSRSYTARSRIGGSERTTFACSGTHISMQCGRTISHPVRWLCSLARLRHNHRERRTLTSSPLTLQTPLGKLTRFSLNCCPVRTSRYRRSASGTRSSTDPENGPASRRAVPRQRCRPRPPPKRR